MYVSMYGNCSFEQILVWKYTPLSGNPTKFCVDFCLVNLLTLTVQTAYNAPLHFGIRKRPSNEFWIFLTASPFAGLLQDFFKARFRFLLVRWWSVGKPEDRADRLKKSHFLKALKLFYGEYYSAFLTVDSKKKPLFRRLTVKF